MSKANTAGKPVITATHMLESMVEHRRPTRAEATDVANAILDGTDCVMLSGESAMGRYPAESAQMLADIATATEPHRSKHTWNDTFDAKGTNHDLPAVDLIALSVQTTLQRSHPIAVIVPTRSGATARNVARFRLPIWITAFCSLESTCKTLQFSYGVEPVLIAQEFDDWSNYAKDWLHAQNINKGIALLTQGPSEQNPNNNYRMEIITLCE